MDPLLDRDDHNPGTEIYALYTKIGMTILKILEKIAVTSEYSTKHKYNYSNARAFL